MDKKPKALIVRDRFDDKMGLGKSLPSKMPTIDPDDLIGRSFLTPPNESGERFRATIKRKIFDDPSLEEPSVDNIKFILQVDDSKADEIVEYNYIIDQLNKETLDEFNDDGEKIF